MPDAIDRGIFNSYAKKETRGDIHGGNVNTYWYFRICRLYSGVYFFEGQYKTFMDPLTYAYNGVTKTPRPIWKSNYCRKSRMEPRDGWNFFIAVKELIIEWEDYQREVSGYVYCEACLDHIDASTWFNHANENSVDDRHKPGSTSKQLLRFVKSPGVRNTSIKIQKEDLDFFRIDLSLCDTVSIMEEENMPARCLEVRKEHQLQCEIRSLFDNEPLPIKHAHITVEIHLQ